MAALLRGMGRLCLAIRTFRPSSRWRNPPVPRIDLRDLPAHMKRDIGLTDIQPELRQRPLSRVQSSAGQFEREHLDQLHGAGTPPV